MSEFKKKVPLVDNVNHQEGVNHEVVWYYEKTLFIIF